MDYKRNDPAFWVDESGSQVVWHSPDSEFYVIRAGEMRLHYKDEVIRYTDDLIAIGLTDDQKLADSESNPDYNWVHNSWFEVCHKEDGDYFSDPIFDLSEAIEYAKTATIEEDN
jgi:hypothetical protein